jgi:hypothetical protein
MRIGGRHGISATAADIAGLNGSFLYVISNGHSRVKIGVTKGPISEIGSLRRQSAASALDFVYIGATSSDGFDIEQAARSALARHRLYGEWFSVPPEVAVAAIARAAQKLGHPIVQLSPDQAAGTAVARAQEAPAAQPKRSLLTGAQKAFLLIVLLAVVAVVMLARLAGI